MVIRKDYSQWCNGTSGISHGPPQVFFCYKHWVIPWMDDWTKMDQVHLAWHMKPRHRMGHHYLWNEHMTEGVMWVSQCHKPPMTGNGLYQLSISIYGDLGDGLWHCYTHSNHPSISSVRAPSVGFRSTNVWFKAISQDNVSQCGLALLMDEHRPKIWSSRGLAHILCLGQFRGAWCCLWDFKWPIHRWCIRWWFSIPIFFHVQEVNPMVRAVRVSYYSVAIKVYEYPYRYYNSYSVVYNPYVHYRNTL